MSKPWDNTCTQGETEKVEQIQCDKTVFSYMYIISRLAKWSCKYPIFDAFLIQDAWRYVEFGFTWCIGSFSVSELTQSTRHQCKGDLSFGHLDWSDGWSGNLQRPQRRVTPKTSLVRESHPHWRASLASMRKAYLHWPAPPFWCCGPMLPAVADGHPFVEEMARDRAKNKQEP